MTKKTRQIMLGQLKDRFLSLQEEITASVKQLAPNEQNEVCRQVQRKDLDSGADLLETWQNTWEELHLINDKNAKAANRCDKLISSIKERSEKQRSDVETLQNHVPRVNQGVKEIMEKLGGLESLLADVEISLLALEDTIDAREMQEKQLDQRFQLAMYQERRKAEFNDLATRLQNDYDKKKAQIKAQQKAKQKYYQEKFDQDMEEYKSTGHLQVPHRHDPDASLESVDLNDTDEDEGATRTLEAFLNEPDALYDVSPLPRDETPLQKVDDIEQVPCEVPINVVQAETSPNATEADSLYYTPDVTTEKLSEISLN